MLCLHLFFQGITIYNATAAGTVNKIVRKVKDGYEINIADALDGRESG